MKYFLDTSTIIDIFNGNKEALFNLDITPIQDVYTSALVYTELAAGMQGIRPNSVADKMAQNFMKWATVEPFGRDAALIAGELLPHLSKSGKPIGQMDTLIAAHALAVGATLVTANTKHFQRIPGLTVSNWSKPNSK
jgi:tRNA(fMet)-specific endonuclease VapC